jgi:putative addiction module component (TIGR02574 family)
MSLKFCPMTLAQFPALRKLPKRQKLELAEALWSAAVDDTLPVRAEDRVLLDSRWKAYRAGKVTRISLEELERRVARK